MSSKNALPHSTVGLQGCTLGKISGGPSGSPRILAGVSGPPSWSPKLINQWANHVPRALFPGFECGAPYLQSQGKAPWGRGWSVSLWKIKQIIFLARQVEFCEYLFHEKSHPFNPLSVRKKYPHVAIWEIWATPPKISYFLNGKVRFWSVYVLFIKKIGGQKQGHYSFY